MFIKDRKGRIRGVNIFNTIAHKENHKLITTQCGRITQTQIEAARRVIAKQVKRKAKYKSHIRANTSVSTKPSEVRMGKGKGAIDYYICRVKAGQLIFSIDGIIPIISAKSMFLRAARKLPVKIKIIYGDNKINN